jgi:hypothetical protein
MEDSEIGLPFSPMKSVPLFVPKAIKLMPISPDEYQLDFSVPLKLSYWKLWKQFNLYVDCPYFSVGLKIHVSVVRYRRPGTLFSP